MDAAASSDAPPEAPPRHEFTATPETPKLLPRTIHGPEHEDYRRGVRRFFETEVYPHWEAWEAQGHVARDLWDKAGEAGLLSVAIPEEFGGLGADRLFSTIVMEEQARVLASGPGLSLHSEIVAPWENPVARSFVDNRAHRIYGGTNDIMKELISRAL